MINGVLIPVSDSGKAEQTLDLSVIASALTVVLRFVSCAKITFRNQELFGYFLAAQKVSVYNLEPEDRDMQTGFSVDAR